MPVNILVTGGAGYIGSHACKALARAGYRPIAFDNLDRGHADAVRWGPLVRGDIRDAGALRAALKDTRPAAVLHFAGYAYVGESVAYPERYYDRNVTGTAILLEAMREAGVRRLIFSSTCATYGIPDALPVTERSLQRPINPYGQSKLLAEQAIIEAASSWGLRHFILRYFNAAGADPEGEAGESHDPEPHLIPRVLMTASGRLERLEILGADYPTPDGTCIRDYLHVSDLAQAHILALSSLIQGAPGGVLNLGTGMGHSVRNIVETVEAITGKRVPVTISPRRIGDPPHLIADASLATKLLGVKYPRSGLHTIIETAWAWHKRSQPKEKAVLSVETA